MLSKKPKKEYRPLSLREMRSILANRATVKHVFSLEDGDKASLEVTVSVGDRWLTGGKWRIDGCADIEAKKLVVLDRLLQTTIRLLERQ
jgi:hypothetical protein